MTDTKELCDCPKCGGSGIINGFEHVESGRCFRCEGSGKVIDTGEREASPLRTQCLTSREFMKSVNGKVCIASISTMHTAPHAVHFEDIVATKGTTKRVEAYMFYCDLKAHTLGIKNRLHNKTESFGDAAIEKLLKLGYTELGKHEANDFKYSQEWLDYDVWETHGEVVPNRRLG